MVELKDSAKVHGLAIVDERVAAVVVQLVVAKKYLYFYLKNKKIHVEVEHTETAAELQPEQEQTLQLDLP